MALLPIIMGMVSLRWMFISLSPQLAQMLTFDMDVPTGSLLMLAAGAVGRAAGCTTDADAAFDPPRADRRLHRGHHRPACSRS